MLPLHTEFKVTIHNTRHIILNIKRFNYLINRWVISKWFWKKKIYWNLLNRISLIKTHHNIFLHVSLISYLKTMKTTTTTQVIGIEVFSRPWGYIKNNTLFIITVSLIQKHSNYTHSIEVHSKYIQNCIRICIITIITFFKLVWKYLITKHLQHFP